MEQLRIRSNVTPQFRKDCILWKLVETPGVTQGIFVDSGTWDGKWCRNHQDFIPNPGWMGHPTEGKPWKLLSFIDTHPENP